MNKLVGYILSLIGLIGIVISSGKGKEIAQKFLPFLSSVPSKPIQSNYILIAGVVIIAAGIVFLILAGKGMGFGGKQSAEVPIYEGRGKKRRVVGYQRE